MEEGEYFLIHPSKRGQASIKLGAASVLVIEGDRRREILVKPGEMPSKVANPILLEFTKSGYEIADIRVATSAITPDNSSESHKPGVEDWFDETVTFEDDTAIVDAGETEVTGKKVKAVVAKVLDRSPRKLWLREYALLDREPYASFKDWIQAVATIGSNSLEEIVVDSGDTLTRQASVALGNLSALVSACPNLLRAKLLGSCFFEPITHKAITSLALLGDNLKSTAISGLLQSNLPELRHLHLGLSYEQEAKKRLDDELLGGLGSMTLRLDHLTIGYPNNPLRMLEKLFDAEIWNKIPSLFLEANLDPEETVQFLKAHREQITRLKVIGLKLTELTHEERNWITIHLPNMKLDIDSAF